MRYPVLGVGFPVESRGLDVDVLGAQTLRSYRRDLAVDFVGDGNLGEVWAIEQICGLPSNREKSYAMFSLKTCEEVGRTYRDGSRRRMHPWLQNRRYLNAA
jgi:hypothetical protein